MMEEDTISLVFVSSTSVKLQTIFWWLWWWRRWWKLQALSLVAYHSVCKQQWEKSTR